jgi:hypothetical protein
VDEALSLLEIAGWIKLLGLLRRIFARYFARHGPAQTWRGSQFEMIF